MMRKPVWIFVVLSVLATLTGGIGLRIASAHPGHVLTIDDVTVAEGSGNSTGAVNVTVRVAPAPEVGEQVKVDFGTSAQAAQGATAKTTAPGDNTPEFPEDFAQTDGTVTFDALQTSKTISIPVLADNADEPNEIFYVQLFNARGACVVVPTCTTGASVGDSRGTVTISDDDATPAISVNDVTHNEGNSGTTTYSFTVTKGGGSGAPVTVDYATEDGTATSPGDYTAGSDTLTFAPSSPSAAETRTVVINVSGDTTFEPSETFALKLSNADNATISDAEGLGTITNDDAPPPPSMSASDASSAEGDAVNFTVSLSEPPGPGQTAIVDWALESADGAGKATAGTDYVPAAGSVVFTAGESEQTVTVATVEDEVNEAAETFTLKLTKPETSTTGGYTYNIARDLGVGTIANDDPAPTLSIDDVTIETEGGSGTTKEATFTVSKGGLIDRPVTVDVATSDWTASAGSDYTASATELSFAPVETTKEFTVVVKGDELDEPNEAFDVDLSGADNASVADAQGVGTIVDDDTASTTFSISDVSVTEGNSGTLPATVVVKKNGDTGQTTTVSYATVNGAAKSGSDYNGRTGSLSFAPDETTKSIIVEIRGDTYDELSEGLFVNLSNPTNAGISDGQGSIVIVDNDPAPTMRISDASLSEYSTSYCNLAVRLSAKSGREIRVHYTTVSSTATTSDYVAKSGDLKFVPGDTYEQIKIYARSDTRDEPNERFGVRLSGISPSGSASFADSNGVCTIVDND